MKLKESMKNDLRKAFWKKFGAELGGVLVLSTVWALFNGWLESKWDFSSLMKNGGGAMLVIGTVVAYANRAWKQVRDQSNHGDIVTRQTAMEKQVNDRLDASIKRIEASEQSMTAQFDKAAENLEKTVQRVVNYTTGGDSWMKLQAIEIADEQITRLIFFHHGDFPIYTVNLDVLDIINLRRQMNINPVYPHGTSSVFALQRESIAPAFAQSFKTAIPLKRYEVNRLRLNWQARNGSWGQDLEIRWTEDGWATAIRNVPLKGEPDSVAYGSFPLDEHSKPIFSELEALVPLRR